MNYIYDILINFQTHLYDVYDWNKNDDILHLRKIPMFRLDTETLKKLCCFEVQISSEFLSRIFNRTELFQRNKVSSLEYCFLATDLEEVIGFKVDKLGNILGYSKLLLEEEAEVLEYATGLSIYNLSFQALNRKEVLPFKTREEVKIKSFILKEIKQMIKSQDSDKLRYLYLECFGKNIEIDKIKKNIFKEIEQKWDKVYLKLYHFLKMTTSKR